MLITLPVWYRVQVLVGGNLTAMDTIDANGEESTVSRSSASHCNAKPGDIVLAPFYIPSVGQSEFCRIHEKLTNFWP